MSAGSTYHRDGDRPSHVLRPVSRPVAVVAKAIATAGGAGYSPLAPGTCGTLVAVPLVVALSGLSLPVYLAVVAAITLIGIVAAGLADRSWGSHDSGRIVIDEVAGYMLTMAAAPRDFWPSLAIGFVVFRAFDIIKPPPVRWLDRNLPGGYGVVLDDIAAGALGVVVMVGLGQAGLWAHLAHALR